MPYVITAEDLANAAAGEGLEYAIRHYYGRDSLQTITDDAVRERSLAAHDA